MSLPVCVMCMYDCNWYECDSDRVRTVFEGLWKFRKNGISFSRPCKSVETEWGLWKFVNFVVFRALGKNYQLISQKLHFPRPNSSLFFLMPCKITENALPISFDWQSASAFGSSKGCVPFQMCSRVHTFVLLFFAPYCKGLWKVCEFWMDFSVRTLSDITASLCYVYVWL